MMDTTILESIKTGFRKKDFDMVDKAAKDAMMQGISPNAVIDVLRSEFEEIGKKYEKGDLYLPELVVAGSMGQEVLQILKPYLAKGGNKSRGTILLATVAGDVHNIGKNIVAMMIAGAGYEVVDLGVDVQNDEIVEAVNYNAPAVVGLSAMLTTTMEEMEKVIQALVAADVRKNVRIILGGAPVTQEFSERIGADHCARDAVDGVNQINRWLKEREF